jgi:hypothetical protein
MKNIYKKLTLLGIGLAGAVGLHAQCSSTQSLSTASNMFSVIRNGNHPVAVNKALNTVIFLHRNDAGLNGGSSGHLRYDISTNAGTTWTTDIGVLNPNLTNLARYPNGTIYNPSLNVTPTNAYISYLAPTIDPSTSAWNGIVTGVQQFNGTGTTESYNQAGVVTGQIQHSMVNGAPGVFWAIEPQGFLSGYIIHKGVWSSTASDIVWSSTHTLTPSYASGATVGDYNIGFDPTGTFGWVSLLTHVTPGPSNQAMYPVLYKTIDGGSTWTGPYQADLTKMSCITSNTNSGSFPSTNIEHDLVVDALGNPHVLTTVGNSSFNSFNYSLWHHMYDITMKNGVFVAYDIANVNAAPHTFGISPDLATQWMAPQAARTADGNKVFFTWTDNSSYSLGQANTIPDLFGRALDITTGNWTPVKNFTGCNTVASGKVLFPHIAPEVLEPSTNVYKIAPVYGEMTSPNSLLLTARFNFLDNVTFSSSEFTIATPPATVSIVQGTSIMYCPNTTISINVANNPGDVIWSTGANTNTLSITSGTASTYSVVAQVGCLSGTASIAVTTLTMNVSTSSGSICPGTPFNAAVTGNATSYTWSPGNVTGSNVVLMPIVSPVTVSANGSGCIATETLGVSFHPQPTITLAGSNTVCSLSNASITASGAQSYAWISGSNVYTGATFTAMPPSPPTGPFTATVFGTAANSCTNSASIQFVVLQSPTVTANASNSMICEGHTTSILAFGAQSYSLNGIHSPSSVMAASPLSSSIFTVTGASANLCESSALVQIIVEPSPSLTITPARASFCRGERIVLTASGANSYTWVTQGVLNSTVQVNPVQTTTYTIIGESPSLCTNTVTYVQTVAECTGLDALGNAGNFFVVYPNPAGEAFEVRSNEELEIYITDISGKLIQNFSLKSGENKKVDAQDLQGGIYFIHSTNSEGRPQTHKLLIGR